MIDYSFFIYIGSFDLMILVIQDLRTMKIDERWNWVMGGVVTAMVLLAQRPILYLVAILLMSIVFPMATKKFFAKGDIQVLSWQIMGLGILGPTWLGIFWLMLPVYLLTNTVFKWMYKIKENTPGLPVLAATFWTTAIVFYMIT